MRTFPIPPEARPLLRQTERLFNQEEKPDPFTIERLTNAARKIRVSHETLANHVLGRISCLNGDLHRMHTCHRQIINTHPDQASPLFDYSQSLRKLGFYSEARQAMAQALTLAPRDRDCIQHHIKCCLCSGRFNLAWQAFEEVNREEIPIYRKQFNFFYQIHPFVTDRALEDDALEAMQVKALAMLHQRKLFPVGVLRSPAVRMELSTSRLHPVEETSGAPFLSWSIQTARDPTELAKLNQTLETTLEAAGIPDVILRSVRLRFIPWSPTGFNQNGFYY